MKIGRREKAHQYLILSQTQIVCFLLGRDQNSFKTKYTRWLNFSLEKWETEGSLKTVNGSKNKSQLKIENFEKILQITSEYFLG